MKFTHKITKGSRFNQIYIPLEMNNDFDVGDLVEVRLLEKKTSINLSKNLGRLNEFKMNLIKEIFSELKKINEIKKVFIIGSFLTNKEDYNDIDILVISDNDLSKLVFSALTNKFEIKFHVISIPEEKFNHLIGICPLTRSMLCYFATDKPFSLPNKTEVDKKHIEFLLMMPQDLLDIKVNSKAYYDALRRLIAIEKFLKNKEVDNKEIIDDLNHLLGKEKLDYIKENEPIEGILLKKIREIIKLKIKNIRMLLDKK